MGSGHKDGGGAWGVAIRMWEGWEEVVIKVQVDHSGMIQSVLFDTCTSMGARVHFTTEE